MHSDPLVNDAIAACSALIGFDTTNFGGGNSRGELEAAEWVAEQLDACGYDPNVLESAPGRGSTIVRIPGDDRTRPALMVHGHLDVVPADVSEWSVDPFGGEVRDGYIWGRGALDMKGMVASMVAIAQGFARERFRPPRDIVLAFVADEEDTGRWGAGHVVEHHAGLLEGVSHAIGEGGGTLTRLPDGSHLFPVTAAERGTAWIELSASGKPGHGSRPSSDNAITALATAVTRLAAIAWPQRIIPVVAALIDGLERQLGVELDPADPGLEAKLGDATALVAAVTGNTLSPTMLSAGYKANVIPSQATAVLDGRMLPGYEQEFFAAIDAALPEQVTRRFVSHQPPICSDHHDPELGLMQAALRADDPGALVLPYCSVGGTDAKLWSRLGIACFGFSPEWTEPGADEAGLVHGIDERISIKSLAFGTRVLDRYLRSAPAIG